MGALVGDVERRSRGSEGGEGIGEDAEADGEIERIGALPVDGHGGFGWAGQRLGHGAGPDGVDGAEPLHGGVATDDVHGLDAGAGQFHDVVAELVEVRHAGIFLLGGAHGDVSFKEVTGTR